MRRKPTARMKRGSVKKSKLMRDFDFPDFAFFSFSGFLKELVLNVFSAIVNLQAKINNISGKTAVGSMNC